MKEKAIKKNYFGLQRIVNRIKFLILVRFSKPYNNLLM